MSFPRSSSERAGSINSQDSSQKTALHTKNDPNLALYEAQPIAVNTQPATRDIVSLRSMQHKDRDGRVISDPDLSNPTRNRLERPLDTIRSFQAAIESHRRHN